jgi:HEAT repeat protein
MSSVTLEDLVPWNDADELLQALGRVDKTDASALADAVKNLLEHEDEDVREEAIRVAGVHWTLAEVREKAEFMLHSDEAASVRRTAAYAISALATDATKLRDTRILLHVLTNDAEQDQVRRAAYEGLLLLHGRNNFPPINRDVAPATLMEDPWLRRLIQSGGAL